MRAAAEDLNAAQLMGIKVNRVVATAFAIGAGAGRGRRASCTRSRPARSTRTWASRRSSRRSSPRSSAASAASPGRCSAATSSASSRSSSPPWPGIGDLLPPGSVSPEVRAFLQQWLPSSLASYRDAVVFIVLILVLLVRPQGILGRRDARGTWNDRRSPRPPGPLLRHRPVVDRPGRPRRERPGVLAGPRHQPRALHHPDRQPQPDERLHRRVLARPDRVHGPGCVHLGDPDPAAPGEERLPAEPAVVARGRPPRPGRSGRSRSGSWSRR